MSLYVLEGLRPWVIQRVSAVYIIVFTFYVLYCLATTEVSTPSFDAWRGWLFSPINTTLVGLFIIALLFHAWIGMRDVALDYIHNTMLRIFVLGMMIGVLLGSGLWLFRVLLLSVVA